jgi:two-component system cell cycle sensor histidine kinase PleC
VPLSGHRLHSTRRQKTSLLARYSETLGEMMLRTRTEIAIRAARQEAELNDRAKSAFLSTMSHELRTPLNAIIGFSDLLQLPGAASGKDAAEYASHIAKAGRRLLDVVGDVLDMSKLEAGSLALNCAPTAISDVIAAVAEDVRPLFAEKRQLLDIRADRVPQEIEADAKRLRQLLAHLLSNASKFTPAGGRILVLARPAADGGVTVAVADTGIGMTHEEMMLALRPFAQVDARRARNAEGAGLGLPLALGLARLHGGSLHIESQPGNGTTVMLSLPRRAAAPSALSHSSSAQGKAA